MATYRVLYWQEIPSQIRAEDEQGNDASLELPPRFMERIDAVANRLGYVDSDEYLAQWHWSEEFERAGSAQEVAEAVRNELDARTDW
jgi:hypothetical protein